MLADNKEGSVGVQARFVFVIGSAAATASIRRDNTGVKSFMMSLESVKGYKIKGNAMMKG